VNALRALERGEQPRTPRNWLLTIAHNLIRQRFRQQYVRPHQVELDADIPMLEADDSGPSLEDLVRALQRIPESQREALVLRELEGRSYKEMAAILGVSRAALEGLIFRARRSLAEELENLVTCDRAELALSRQADDRLSRKERRRLVAHLEECTSCARVAALSMKHRRAFKGLALLPLPFSLTLFKGAPSASAAAGLPTIGSVAAGGGAAAAGTGLAAKLAIGVAAVAVASGAGYEGVKAVHDPPTPARAAPVAVAPDPAPATVVSSRVPRAVAPSQPIAKTTKPAKAAPVKAPAKATAKGRSAAAPGHTKATPKPRAAPRQNAAPKQRAAPKPKAAPQPKTVRRAGPKTAPASAKAPPVKKRPQPTAGPKPKKSLVAPELPAPPALPRRPHDEELLPELVPEQLGPARP
jgi:RNA polymerase sigma factor (sigma-70 family)